MTSKVVAPIFVPMSLDQAGRAADRFVTKCRKDGETLPHDIVQEVLEQEGDALAEEQFIALRTRVERRAEMIVCHFKVDRTKSRETMIASLGRKEYVDADVLATMPTDGPDEGDLFFFPLKRDTPVSEIPQAFESRDLVPDYMAQMQVNADDPAFADEHPNGMQWGKNSCAAFDGWRGERRVSGGRGDNDWDGHCWLAGRRKVSTQT